MRPGKKKTIKAGTAENCEVSFLLPGSSCFVPQTGSKLEHPR